MKPRLHLVGIFHTQHTAEYSHCAFTGIDALQNANEGDSRVFLNSWNAAFAMGLLSAELIVTVQEIAAEYDLPEAFIEALAAA